MNTTSSSQRTAVSPAGASETSLWMALRGLPRAAWVLFLGIFLNRFGTFVIPFLTLYLTGKGYSLADAGFAIGSYGLGTLLACFYGGQLADQIGRRKTIALSMAGGAVTMLLLARAETWGSIVALTTLNGLCGELYRPASSALLADLVPGGQRVIAFSAYRIALNAGWAFGPATAGFLANHSFQWLFVGDAFTSLLFGLVAWVALPHGVRAAAQESGWGRALATMRANREFLRIIAATLFIAWVFLQISSTYSLFITHLGYSPLVYGALISLNGALIVLCELSISNVTRKFPPRGVVACGFLLIAIGFGLNAFATRLPLLALGIIILTFGEMLSLPITAAWIADIAPAEMRGRYMGAHGLTWGLALVFGPACGMFLYAHGPALLWLTCACSGVFGAVLLFQPGRLLRRGTWRTAPITAAGASGRT